MSFSDDPIVDENSKRSEESVNAVKSLFTRKRGFITREEIPDYGVDFDVELVYSETGASSKKFAIQIKSTSVVKQVTHSREIYLSTPFKTSRLGYLARREPAYGIIVLYDEETQICYYDFVEEVIKRLDNTDGRQGWREQENVSVLLPLNIITQQELEYIHQKFTNRHQNSHLLLIEYGQKFNIPVLNLPERTNMPKIALDNASEVAKFLEKFGSLLYNEHEFKHILRLLGQVNKNRIANSTELIFLSAITYTQEGDVIEAEYYIRKALKMADALTEEQKSVIAFSQIRIEFLKGDIDRISFLKKLRELSKGSNRIENQLIIDINLLFFELNTNILDDKFNPGILDKFSALSQKIEDSGLSEEKKHQLRVFHSESQHNYAVQTFITTYTESKLKEQLGIKTVNLKRLHYSILTNEITNAAEHAVQAAYFFSAEHKRPLLRASASHQLAKNFLSLRSALSMLAPEDRKPVDPDKLTTMYFDYQQLALIGYNGFLQLQMLQNAHEAMVTAYEIYNLCKLVTGKTIGTLDPEDMLKTIREIESTYDLQAFESAIPILAKFYPKEEQDYQTILLEADEDMIQGIAKKFLDLYGIPESRLQNIIDSMRMRKVFHQRCSNPNIVMLEDQSHSQNLSTHYIIVPPCILKEITTNRTTRPSTDIEFLLKEFADILVA